METEPTIKIELTQTQALCLAGEYVPVIEGGKSIIDIEREAQGNIIGELHKHGLWPVDG